MTRMEHSLNHGERPLTRRSLPVDTPVPQPVPYPQGMTPSPTPHGDIVAPWLDAEVAFIQVHDFTLPRQVHLAVVDIRRCGLQVPYEVAVGVSLDVELVPE